MKTAPSDRWLFDIKESPVFTTIAGKDELGHGVWRKVEVPNKKALIAADTGHVLGIVGSGYRVFTNQEAVDLCERFCLEAFTDTEAAEWSLQAGHGPSTRSWAALDIHHCAHAMNLMGIPGGVSEEFTPFVRISNSYNGSRAVRIDIGFMRKHCENGVIFEQDAATISVPHTTKGLAALKIANPFANMADLCAKFNATLVKVRAVAITPEDTKRLVHKVVEWPSLNPDSNKRDQIDQQSLDADLADRTDRYFGEIGGNAYAAFNVMTDLAARPPESRRFRRDRPTLERRAGAWLRDFTAVADSPGFDWGRHIEGWSIERKAAPFQPGAVR
jgi:hypothetical protein